MGVPAGRHGEQEHMVGGPLVVDDVDLLDAQQQRGVDELEGRATQAVDLSGIGIDALDPTLAQSDGDKPALGVRHTDDRSGELLGIDAERLALEPLRLRCGDEPCASGLRVEAEQRVKIDLVHEFYCK